jgi:hypothetical protein
MNGACTYRVQPPNIIMFYRHFLSKKCEVVSLSSIYIGAVLSNMIKVCVSQRNNSRNNRDYSLKFSNLFQFNEYGLGCIHWFSRYDWQQEDKEIHCEGA